MRRTLVRSRSYFRRHKRALTIVGALIVFATFVVKDGIRDDLKDRLDTINQAETTFNIRQDTNREIESRITNEWREMGEAIDRNAKLTGPAWDSFQRQQSDFLDQTDDALNSSYGNLFQFELAAQLFDAPALPDLSAEHKLRKKFQDNYQMMIAGQATDDDYFKPSPTDEHDLQVFKNYENDADFNLTKNDLVGTHLIELVEKRREQYAQYLSILNFVSYVLYVVGWALSLLGGLFRVTSGSND